MKPFMYLILLLILSSCMPVKFSKLSSPDAVFTIPYPVVNTLPVSVSKCSDSHASNSGAEGPCSCNSGYDLSTDTFHCNLRTVPICETYSQPLSDKIMLGNDLIGNPQGLSLKMQTDGNLVLYNGNNNYWNSLWNSGTYACGPNCRTQLQSDGNVVVYNSSLVPIFYTSTMGCTDLTITNCSRPALKISGCANSIAAAPVAPPNWVHCANELGLCSFTGVKTVRFGSGGNYSYKTISGSMACNVQSMGDPTPGVTKTCDYDANTADSEPLTPPTGPQILSSTSPNNLVLTNVSGLYNFGPDANGIPFDWGFSNPGFEAFAEFGINVPTDSDYKISLKVSTIVFSHAIVTVDGNTVGTVPAIATGAWGNYQDFELALPVKFPAGTYRLRIEFPMIGSSTTVNFGGITLTPVN